MEELINKITAFAGLACGQTQQEKEYYLRFCDEMYKLEVELKKAGLIKKTHKKPSKMSKNFVLGH